MPIHLADYQSSPKFKFNQHICAVYKTQEECQNIIMPFFIQGLKKSEKCLYINDSDSNNSRHIYNDLTINSLITQNPGQLQIISYDKHSFNNKSFDQFQAIKFLKKQVEQALSEGYESVRIVCAIDWSSVNEIDLIQFEARLNIYFISIYPCTLLCLYDAKKFSPHVIRGLIANHPMIMQEGSIQNNFSYVSPRAFLNLKGGKSAIKRLMIKFDQASAINNKFIGADESSRRTAGV